MLIDSPRLTPQDRQAWQRLARYDALLAQRLPLERMADDARRVIREFADAGTCYASTSWGKDSTVLSHLVATCGIRLPLVYVRMREWENPDCLTVRDVFLARYGDRVDYHEYWVDGSPRWWDPEAAHARKDHDVARYWTQPERAHGKRHISGVRAQESRIRRIAQARWGTAGPGACRPIGEWAGTDVFAYLHAHDLPVHPAYAMSFGGHLDRVWLRVSPIGSVHQAHKRRADWEARYYPDIVGHHTRGDS